MSVRRLGQFVSILAALLCSAISFTASAAVLEVGAQREYGTVCDAIQQAEAGDVILLSGQTFSGSCSWSTAGLTIRGEGSNTLVRVEANQATWQIMAAETVIENVTFIGERTAEAVGAAIEQFGGRLTLRQIRIHGAAIGIRAVESDGSTLTIEQSEIYGNQQNVLVGRIDEFNLYDSYIHDAKGGDSIDTAAVRNNLRNNKVTSKSAESTGRELVIRDSQATFVAGNLIQRTETIDNGVFVQYINTLGSSGHVEIIANTFLSDRAGVLFVESVGSATPFAQIQKNVFWGGLIGEALGSELASHNCFASAPQLNPHGRAILTPTGVPSDWGASAALLDQVATHSAQDHGNTKRAEFAISAPAVNSVVLPVTTIVGGSYTKATVYLVAAAPAGGTYITLTSSHPSIAYPIVSTLWISGGALSGVFLLQTAAPVDSTSVTITAAVIGSSASATISVVRSALKSLVLEKTQVGSNALTRNNRIYLTGPAPIGGMVVYLSQSNGFASAPPSVTIAAGASSAVFTLTAASVASPQSVTITAHNATDRQSAALTVVPLAVEKFEGVPSAVVGGSMMIVKAYLNGPVPSDGFTIFLKSSDTATIPVPVSIMASAGATYGSAAAWTKSVTAARSVTVTATTGATEKPAVITVKPLNLYSVVSSSSVAGGSKLTVIVKLDGPAPADGFPVLLSSSSSSVLSVPLSVTVPAGSSSVSFSASAGMPSASTPVTVYGSAKSITKTKLVTVLP